MKMSLFLSSVSVAGGGEYYYPGKVIDWILVTHNILGFINSTVKSGMTNFMDSLTASIGLFRGWTGFFSHQVEDPGQNRF